MPRSTSWLEQATQNRVIGLVLAMLVAVPLIASPLDHNIGGVTALVFEGFSAVMLAVLLWNGRWNLKKERIREFLVTGANAPVLGLMALALVSCLFAAKKPYAIQETLRLGAGILLYFVVAYQFRRSEQLTKLADVIVFLAIGMSLIGFLQFATSSERYATGPFGDHQLFGSFLMLLLPIVAVIAVTEKAQNRQIVAQVATVMTGASLLLAHTRSAWMGAAAAVIVLGMLVLMMAGRKSSVAGRKHEIALPVMLLIVATGFFLLVSPDSSSIMGRAATFGNMKGEEGWNYRQHIWSGTLNMIKARPISGFGIGQYNLYAPKYTGVGYAVANSGQRPLLDDNAHNYYLQTAAELGISGIALLAVVLGSFWFCGLRRLRGMEVGIRRTLLIGTMASAAAFAVDAAASPSWQFGQLTLMLWAILGAGVSCIRPHVKTKEEAVSVLPLRATRSAAVVASALLAVLLPATVFAAGGGNYRGYPVSAALTPKSASLKVGNKQQYTLQVKFSGGSTIDVSEENTPASNSVFSGTGSGPWSPKSNGVVPRVYTAVQSDTAVSPLTITGTYTWVDPVYNNTVVKSDTASLRITN